MCCKCYLKSDNYVARTITIGRPELNPQKFPKNVVRNQKYSILTFMPLMS